MTPWQYVLLAGLGAFHGLNPGMGWLLALAGGVRERRRAAIAATLGPIALGHAASVFAVAMLVVVLVSVTTAQLVTVAGGVLLTGFGLWRLRAHRHATDRHPGRGHVLAWSFLMSSAHGAGLALLPVLVAAPMAAGAHHDHAAATAGVHPSALTGLLATAVHTGAMVAVAGVVALAAYQLMQLPVLRSRLAGLPGASRGASPDASPSPSPGASRSASAGASSGASRGASLGADRIWAVALAGSGLATLAVVLWPR